MTSAIQPANRLSPRVIIAVFAGVFGLLAIGYFFFLKVDYAPIYTDLRTSDAAAIVAQLDAKHIGYRLSNGGTTILVPADQADQAKVAIAGSDVPLNGGVGFELFNKSDMGLTDFAQRINYQRALQGELERTIMMLDEIDRARVHLALPEKSIFRSERSNAKAAVEVAAKPGRQLDGERVAGIQRLVAFAVPDLAPADVVILDVNGRVLSQAATDDAPLSPDAEERRSVEQYYRARARAAFARTLPGVEADINVITLDREEGAIAESAPSGQVAASGPSAPSSGAISATSPTPSVSARNFRLRVIVATSAPLNQEETALVRSAISSAVALNEGGGDELAFRIGLGPGMIAPRPTVPADAATVAVSGTAPPPQSPPWFYWLSAVIAMVVLAMGAIRLVAGRPSLSSAERDLMVERLRAALRQTDSADVGV